MRTPWIWIVPFAFVASCARARPAAPSGGPSGDLALTRLSDGFYVKASLGNGQSGLFLIDTGSYCCFATPKGERMLRKAGADVDADGTLTTGPADLEGFPVAPLEFTPWGKNQDTMDAKADGILGLDFLGRYDVGLEMRTGTLRLWPKDGDFVRGPLGWLYAMGGSRPGGRPPRAISDLPMTPSKGLFTVPVRLDGKTIGMVPDSGSGDSDVSARNARRMGWTRWTGGHDSHLYYGAVHLRHYEIHRFTMGAVEYRGAHNVNVTTNDRDINFVGRDALAGMAMLFDFENRTLFVVPNRRGANPRRPAP